jgi:hypothetical protein
MDHHPLTYNNGKYYKITLFYLLSDNFFLGDYELLI